MNASMNLVYPARTVVGQPLKTGLLLTSLTLLALIAINWPSISCAAPKLDVEEDPTNTSDPIVRAGDLYVQRIWSATKPPNLSDPRPEKHLCMRVENRGPYRSPEYRGRAASKPGLSTVAIAFTWQESLPSGESRDHCDRVPADLVGSYLVRGRFHVRDFLYPSSRFKNLPVYRAHDPNLANNRRSAEVTWGGSPTGAATRTPRRQVKGKAAFHRSKARAVSQSKNRSLAAPKHGVLVRKAATN